MRVAILFICTILGCSSMASAKVYTGDFTREISFPLGGIGTGSIGLAGNGALVDWEIFNRPNKHSENGFSHFAVKATRNGKLIDARVLVGDARIPHSGLGFSRYAMQGFPHFKSTEFIGEFPIAMIRFDDAKFPGIITETAFNPFIPLNDKDSTIPAAFFSFEITNTTTEPIMYTVSLMVKNLTPPGKYTEVEKAGNFTFLRLKSNTDSNSPPYGDMTIATDTPNVSFQQYSYRSIFFDSIALFWKDLKKTERLVDRTYPVPDANNRTDNDDHGVIAAHFELKPSQTKAVRFVISWNFPNACNYWNPQTCDPNNPRCNQWKNYYAVLFRNSTDSACYALKNWDRLYSETLKFKNALFSSTLPPYVLDAVSANISILKTPTVLRLEDGSFYGFEGCGDNSGYCWGNSSHVWNYAYALPYLFPSLQRTILDNEYKYSMLQDGLTACRLELPLGRGGNYEMCPPVVDGMYGSVMKAYREWKISGNDEWLRSNWPGVKKTIEFAWSPANKYRWDTNKDGVLEGRQQHTLDSELLGPNTWLTGFYLLALKAGAEMAEYLGEKDVALEYRSMFEKGKAWVDKNLFNGEYYYQKIDVNDKSMLEPYKQSDAGYEGFLWSDDFQQIKYQFANGCHCDQVIAQWHANLLGLGEIFDRKQVRSALNCIYKYNFKKSMRDFINPCRIFALNDEASLVIGTWPKGDKPIIPPPYAEESMNGFEYQVAIHMIQEGMVEQGLEVVKAIRDRYDGAKRNPWDEVEFGHNYARSMASYALVPALSGFQVDMVKKHIGFAPVIKQKEFSTFWSVDGAWGTYKRKHGKIILTVLYGKLTLNSFSDSLLEKASQVKLNMGSAKKNGSTLVFESPLLIVPEQPFEIQCRGM